MTYNNCNNESEEFRLLQSLPHIELLFYILSHVSSLGHMCIDLGQVLRHYLKTSKLVVGISIEGLSEND